MSGDDGETLGSAVGTVWKRNSNDYSILPETQRHELRATAAQPEVFHLGGVAGIRVDGRGQIGIGFQPKKSSFLKIAERCTTARVGTLRQHTEPIALSIFNICVTPQCDGRATVRSSGCFACFSKRVPNPHGLIGVDALTSKAHMPKEPQLDRPF